MLCRICLLRNPNYIEIFDDVGKQLNIAEVVEKHLWFKPQPDDGFTSKICKVCWHKIDDFNKFYQMVERAHREYEQSSTSNVVKMEVQCPSPIKLEDGSEELINNTDNAFVESKRELQTKNPLEENYFEASCIDHEESDKEESVSFEDYEPSNSSQEEPSTDESLNKSHVVGEEIITEKKKENTTQKRQKTLQKNKGDIKKKRIVQRLDQEKTEEMIRKHIPMGCNLCIFVGKTFPDIVEHFKSVHPKVRPYIMCCDNKLSKRFMIAQHAMRHEDPNCFSCKECNKSFSRITGLRSHNLNYHARTEDLIYACDSCPKKFASSNLLELHKPSHIPRDQWQYICSKCPDNRKFASNYLLNVHNSMRHNREVNICPVCAKEIRAKKSFEKHVRLHYEDSGPRMKCPYPDCDSWLKDEENLRKHLSRHNTEDTIYKCDECDKECKNRRAITNHKRYAHTSQVFQCDQCDKTFKKAISLREHLTQHTGETLYKCPFCTRTFNSNANMHSHKKKQHPIEWEEWRRNKRGSAQKLINRNNALEQICDTDTLNFFK